MGWQAVKARMRTSVPGNCKRRGHPRGFTLIEVLVALVVMGIALTLVVPQLMPDDRRRVDEEARRLALLLEHAGQEARASGRSLAWSARSGDYRFWQQNEYGDWVRIEDDSALRPRQLPEGMRIALVTLAGSPLEEDELLPLLASYYPSPFVITLTMNAAGTRVVGDGSGRVSVEHDTGAP